MDPVPPLFQPYLTSEETPLLSVKVPRKIERRNARPGMNLYDYVVTLYHEELNILERVLDDVRSVTCPYRDIQCILHGEDLLAGRLRLILSKEAFEQACPLLLVARRSNGTCRLDQATSRSGSFRG